MMPLPFQITFRKDHLEACLLSLGCDVMARERSNFESYSMCYEHVLEHARQKLCQKEQVCSQTLKNCSGESVGREAEESLQRGKLVRVGVSVFMKELSINETVHISLPIGLFPCTLGFSAGKVLALAALVCVLWRCLVGNIRDEGQKRWPAGKMHSWPFHSQQIQGILCCS